MKTTQIFAICAVMVFLGTGCPMPTFTLTYTAGDNGSIAGTTPQTVNWGSDGEEVTAIADDGYHFTTWSDGVATASRADINVYADIDTTASFESSWTTLDFPGASYTWPQGIDGNNIVGTYQDTAYHGFFYNRETKIWTTIDMPGAIGTLAYGIDGNNIVGFYPNISQENIASTRGFLYDKEMEIWTTVDIDTPEARHIYPSGISGNNIVGGYTDVSQEVGHNFIYDLETKIWTTLEAPGAIRTALQGIDGNNSVGSYQNDSGWHGFLYDLETKTWTTIDMPGGIRPAPSGIDGNNIVGYFNRGGFLYDCETKTWAIFEAPGAINTWPQGIDGNNIVGYYRDDSDAQRGFIYTIPES